MYPPPVLDSDRELMDQAKEELSVGLDDLQPAPDSLDVQLSQTSSMPTGSLLRGDPARPDPATPTSASSPLQERAVHWVGTKFNTVKNANDATHGTVRLTRQMSPNDGSGAALPWVSTEITDDGEPPVVRQPDPEPKPRIRRSSTGDKVVKWLNLSGSVNDPQATASVEKRQVFESGNNFFEVIWTDKVNDGDDEDSEEHSSGSHSNSSRSDVEGHTSSRNSDWNWGYNDASADKQLRLKRVNTLLSRWKKRQKRKEKATKRPYCRELDAHERSALEFGKFNAFPGPSSMPSAAQSESTTPDHPSLALSLRRSNSEPKMTITTVDDDEAMGLPHPQEAVSKHVPEIVVHRDSVAINHERLLRRLKRQATPRPPSTGEMSPRRKIKFSDDHEGAMPAVRESDGESETTQETPDDSFPTTVIIADTPKSKPTQQQPDFLVVRYLG